MNRIVTNIAEIDNGAEAQPQGHLVSYVEDVERPGHEGAGVHV
jgi:hypothetical protein